MYEDISGMRFNRWTAIKKTKTDKNTGDLWQCKCDCGTIRNVRARALKSGHSKSCGCYKRQRSKEYHTIHGFCGSRIYKIYKSIKGRCFNKSNSSYKYYGGRGITICDEWKNDFEEFYIWAMSNGYRDDLTIERINVYGNYEPSNCTWIPLSEQSKNQRLRITNKCGCKGVTYLENMKKYQAIIGKNGKRIYLGRYDDLQDAIHARKQAEIKYWGIQQ